MRARFVFAVYLAFLALVAASPAKAVVIYSYSGNNYENLTNNILVPVAWDTSMSVTGSFSVANPLLNLPAGTDISASVLNYSFFDGIQTLTDSNSAMTNFEMSTDVSGAPLSWFILFIAEFPTPTSVDDIRQTIVTRAGFPVTGDLVTRTRCLGVDGAGACNHNAPGAAQVSGNPGTWSVAAPEDPVQVPEPGSLSLLLSGLIALGALRWRRPQGAR